MDAFSSLHTMDMRSDEEEFRKDILSEQRGTRQGFSGAARKFFIAAAVVMLVFLPFFRDYIPIAFSIAGVVLIFLCIIFTDPIRRRSSILNVIAAVAAIAAAEYFTFLNYHSAHSSLFYMLILQAIALLFLLALYFNIKTLGNLLQKKF